jgi:hypothetical protein
MGIFGNRLLSSFAASKPFILGILEIKNDDIRCGLLGSLDGFLTVRSLPADLPRILLLKESSQAAAHKSAVVDKEDSCGRGFRPCVPNSHDLNLRGKSNDVYT